MGLVPTRFPGYFLLDSGKYLFRVGYLIGLDTQGEWMHIAVVRGGQAVNGRFWHSVERLATYPRLATVRPVDELDDRRTGFLLDGRPDNSPASLIVGPVKWHSGETIRIQWAQGDEWFRICRLLEANPDFRHFQLEEISRLTQS
jgi:hypothetical protein